MGPNSQLSILGHISFSNLYMSFRSRDACGGINTKSILHGDNTSSDHVKDAVGNEGSSKQKMWDTNVVMEDSEEYLKRSCAMAL